MATLVLSDVEALKGWLRVTGSSLDVLVEDLENSTVRILEALVGRTYALDAGHVEILDGEGASSVVLSDAPPSGTLTETGRPEATIGVRPSSARNQDPDRSMPTDIT